MQDTIHNTVDGVVHPHIRQHLLYYSTMTGLQVLGFFLVLDAAPRIGVQMVLVVVTSIIYFFWALLHHYLHHDLHRKIVLEYMLVGLLGITVSFFVFQMQR